MMQLSLVENQERWIHLDASGDIRQEDVWLREPLQALQGPDIFERTIILNLDQTTSIDSSGIGWLLLSDRRFRENGGRLILHSLPEIVLQTLKFLHVHTKLTIAPDAKTARLLAQNA